MVSSVTLEALESLWVQMAQFESEYLLIDTKGIFGSDKTGSEQFSLLLGQNFSILFLAIPLLSFTANDQAQKESYSSYKVMITWNKEQIAQFIKDKNIIHSVLPEKIASPEREREFLLNLFNIVALDRQDNIFQPIQTVSEQSIRQEKLLYQVISHIRQSLDLQEILQTTVQEVRDFLQVDRLVIFQFNHTDSLNDNLLGSGEITYEALSCQDISSLLHLIPADRCFTYIPQHQEKFTQGTIVTINDVEESYASHSCLLESLNKYQIKSKMVAPIVVRGDLWGLLIAHQCLESRSWLVSETTFLGRIGEHLSVAIDQAQLYAELQKEKNNFELRVIKRTQELRDSLEASQSANRSKNAFLDRVSHELRTPLTSVIGLSGTLLHWSSTEIPLPIEKQHRYLQTIQKSGKQLLELIDEILELSQLEGGNSPLNIRQFSLKQAGNLVISILQDEAKNNGVNLEFQLRTDLEQDIFWGDSERIQQILFHLLSNALKFTPSGGQVILKIWRGSQEAVFQIEDNGIGISEADLSQLFERFEQLEKYRGRIYPGMGLGLALTKQLVDLNHGRIEVESVVEKGSTFTVWIPDNPGKKYGEYTKKIAPPILFINKTIILIEKDEEAATLICELLTAAEYQIVWLVDAASAVRRIELLQPKLVMVDKEISELYSISYSLRRLKSTLNVKILLLSNTISCHEQEEIDDYLLKPIQPNLLLQRITSLFRYES